MASTSAIAAKAGAAAREGSADDRMLEALLERARQQDKAQQQTTRVLAGLLVLSVIANLVLVSLVLGQSFSASGFGVEVGVGAEQAQEATP